MDTISLVNHPTPAEGFNVNVTDKLRILYLVTEETPLREQSIEKLKGEKLNFLQYRSQL